LEADGVTLDPNQIRLIVYDLDGTVYDDNRHFELYAKEIQSHLPESVQDSFEKDYLAVVDGRHPALRIGTFYDVPRDLVLYIKNGQVQRALHWDGTEAPPVVVRELYPSVVVPDYQDLLNVGDLWWVPSAIAMHHGGDLAKNQQAFYAIRDVMADPNFVVRSIPDLKETILGLKGKVVQVLATNSPKPDSEAILTKVGLLGLFDQMYFQSNKPTGFTPIMREILEKYTLSPKQVLSVGDNLVNEIAPARALGCRTAFIDPFGLFDTDDADIVVQTMTELIPTLRALG
jgi:FMN phosphatase YigB (HAD superfamily)